MAPAERDTKFKPKERSPLQPAGQQQKPAGQAEGTSEREQSQPPPVPTVRLPTAGPCCPASQLLLLPRGLGRDVRFRLELGAECGGCHNGRPPTLMRLLSATGRSTCLKHLREASLWSHEASA